jgi:hypothetical protein
MDSGCNNTGPDSWLCRAKKIIVKSSGEEISELELMISDVGDKVWNGRMARMKEVITDQLKRAEYGMKNGKITGAQGAEIISKAQDVIDKVDDMAKNAGGRSGGGHRGGGGFGGGGFGGGGGHRHHDDSGTSDDSDQHGQPNDFLELKHLIDGYYSTTVTASAAAVAVTGTAAPQGANNPAEQDTGSK